MIPRSRNMQSDGCWQPGASCRKSWTSSRSRATHTEPRRQDLIRPAPSLHGRHGGLEHLRRARTDLSIGEQVAIACAQAPDSLKARVVNVEHHLSHIASSYYCSPFDGLTAGFLRRQRRFRRRHGRALRGHAHRDPRPRPSARQPGLLLHGAAASSSASTNSAKNTRSWGSPLMAMTALPTSCANCRNAADGWFRLTEGYFGMHRGGEIGKMTSVTAWRCCASIRQMARQAGDAAPAR